MTNAQGRILDGRAGSVFCRSPIGAEAEAVLAAVEMASTDNCGTTIFTDSQIIVQSLSKPHDQWPWEIAATVAKIHYVMERSQNVRIEKVRRSEVQLADRVAKMMRDGILPMNWLSALEL
ncbi:hypothetical protein LINPERHAP1_LOCUS40999 [Linum perenne]